MWLLLLILLMKLAQSETKCDENWYKQNEMTQCFIFLFANDTKGTFYVSQPQNPSIQPKTSHQSNLGMKTAYQIGDRNCSEIDQNLR